MSSRLVVWSRPTLDPLSPYSPAPKSLGVWTAAADSQGAAPCASLVIGLSLGLPVCCCTHHTTPNTTLGRLLPLALTLLALLAYSSPSTAGHTFKMPPFINNPLPSSMRSKYCITSLYLRAPPGWMRLAQEAAIRGTSGTCGPMGASYCSGNDMSL